MTTMRIQLYNMSLSLSNCCPQNEIKKLSYVHYYVKHVRHPKQMMLGKWSFKSSPCLLIADTSALILIHPGIICVREYDENIFHYPSNFFKSVQKHLGFLDINYIYICQSGPELFKTPTTYPNKMGLGWYWFEFKISSKKLLGDF